MPENIIGKEVYLKKDFQIFDESDWILFLAGTPGTILEDNGKSCAVELEYGDLLEISIDEIIFIERE